VHLAFRAFIQMMRFLGVLTYEFAHTERLSGASGRIIIANHPTLLDAVFVISLLPMTQCVVKKAVWSNPFLAGVMWATGYIQNGDGMVLVDACVRSLEKGDNLLIFPEATRTVPGRKLKLRRGAASVIAASQRPFTSLIITCEPSTLIKGQRWFEIPDRKVHFRISVDEPTDPVPLLTAGEQLSKANRRINIAIENLFVTGSERHGRSN